MTLGAILGASFQVLRRNPRPTFGFSLILNGIIGILSLGVVGLVTVYGFTRASIASAGDQQQVIAGSVGQGILAFLVPVALSVVTAAMLQGIIALEVARGTVGEKLKLGGLWRQARGRIGALIGWSFILVGLVTTVILVLGLLVGLLIAFGGPAGTVAGIILAVLLALGLVVLFVWTGTRVSLVPSALVLERLPLRAAVARSWTLTTGFFWRTFGIELLVWTILSTASQVITAPISLILGLGSSVINPNGDPTGFVVLAGATYVLAFLVTLVFGAITSVVESATAALLYIDLRMRKEGLDLDLSRFVEARQRGDASVADPFLATSGLPSRQTGDPPST